MQILPPKSEVVERLHSGAGTDTLAHLGRITPVHVTLPSDFLTPVTAYLKLSSLRHNSFLLESVEPGVQAYGRFSTIGVNPYQVFGTTEGTDPVTVLEAEIGKFAYVADPKLPGFTGNGRWCADRGIWVSTPCRS